MINTPRAGRGMVVSSHHLAAQAGLRVLRDGGNAIEAMVAATATVSVVYPHMNGIGGDGFWLISTPDARPPVAISGIGRAAAGIDPAWYRERGFDAIPSRGPLAANTVAGTVSSWQAALDISARWGGKLPLGRLLDDAIHYAEHGVPVTALHCADVAARAGEMDGVPGWHDLFMPGGRLPQPGDPIRQPALAETLRWLAAFGLDGFYRGKLARRIAADLERVGSPVTRADLEAHAPIVGDPITVTVGAGRLYNVPPPTQGLASLAILGLFDRLGVAEADGFDHLHAMVEATKQAILLRDTYATDPDYAPEPPEAALSDDRLDALAAKIDRAKAMPWPVAAAPGDTVWLGAIDRDGRAVSFIHSIYWEFGSGTVLRDSGIQWQNRGCSFALDPGAPQELKPRRLPFHTNNPALALLADGRVMVYGTMGGEGQPQTQAAVFSRYAMFGRDLQAAVTAPRWLLGRTWGDVETELRLEDRFGPAVIDALEAAGHKVRVIGSFDALMGHAGAIVLRPDGVLEGAVDPRGDGVVAAY
jgi:gamma-glutamyltranspeptidase